MNDLAEQYSKMVECATELADFLLDQEGGTFALAVVCEILQVLLRSGELSATYLVLKLTCRAGEIVFDPGIYKACESYNFYIEQFVELLHELLCSE